MATLKRDQESVHANRAQKTATATMTMVPHMDLLFRVLRGVNARSVQWALCITILDAPRDLVEFRGFKPRNAKGSRYATWERSCHGSEMQNNGWPN